MQDRQKIEDEYNNPIVFWLSIVMGIAYIVILGYIGWFMIDAAIKQINR